MSAELAALRSSAERGMFPQAAPAHALARERLLQLYRDAWVDRQHLELSGTLSRSEPMSEEDLAGIEWIARLAFTGHCGAQRLLARSLQQHHLESLLRASPDRLAALAAHSELVAQFMVWTELGKAHPDWKRIDAWLDAGGVSCAGLIVSLKVLRECGGEPGDEDARAVMLGPTFAPEMFLRGEFGPHFLLYPFAKWRVDAAAEPVRQSGQRLMERIAGSGSRQAHEYLFVEGLRATPGKLEFLQQWFESERPCVPSAQKACMQLGAMFERGEAGGPNLEAAIPWYERGADTRAWRSPRVFDKSFCYVVAHKVGDDLRVKWLERGIDAGDERCLDIWLVAFARGEMGLRHPREAAERVQRFSAGVDMKRLRAQFTSAIRVLKETANATKDGELAKQWRAVAALLEAK